MDCQTSMYDNLYLHGVEDSEAVSISQIAGSLSPPLPPPIFPSYFLGNAGNMELKANSIGVPAGSCVFAV